MEKRSKRKAPIRFTATLYRPAETGAPVNRFSVGTKNKDLKRNSDGLLTIYMQASPPSDGAHRANWLPAPKGDFSLYIRAYWPAIRLPMALGHHRQSSGKTN